MDTSKQNVVLLHGRFAERINGTLIADIPLCDPNNEGNWMGWTKKELEKRGYDAVCPVIVDVWGARYEQWKAELDKVRIDENTILVGLSAGGYAVLRYLGESGKKVKKVILLAPGSPGDLGSVPVLPYTEEFYAYPITKVIQSLVREQIVIFVSNDADYILRGVAFYKTVLNPRVVELENRGHFSFLIPELSELLEEITRL